MRADRLLSLLMLLQTRGRMTAQKLAKELEVSERTIYRDLTALNTAGIPVYTEHGPGGGCRLLESYRTTLTGLTPAEARALFMLQIPQPLVDLGVGAELRTALLKLSAALPTASRDEPERARQRIHLDSVPWNQADEPAPHLPTAQQAVWQDRQLALVYRGRFNARLEARVSPYGLVAKANVWYLICEKDEQLRVLRVSHIFEARLTDERFARPPDFDLAAFWEKWCAEYEAHRPSFSVKTRITPALIPLLPYYFGEIIRLGIEQAFTDEQGWITLNLPFDSFEAARERILGFGRAVEVLEPLALRLSVADYAQQIAMLYA